MSRDFFPHLIGWFSEKISYYAPKILYEIGSRESFKPTWRTWDRSGASLIRPGAAARCAGPPARSRPPEKIRCSQVQMWASKAMKMRVFFTTEPKVYMEQFPSKATFPSAYWKLRLSRMRSEAKQPITPRHFKAKRSPSFQFTRILIDVEKVS